jgi:hypothetical protein
VLTEVPAPSVPSPPRKILINFARSKKSNYLWRRIAMVSRLLSGVITTRYGYAKAPIVYDDLLAGTIFAGVLLVIAIFAVLVSPPLDPYAFDLIGP